MFALSHSVLVNADPAALPLTAEQVWAGLVLKAENALPFVPVMKRCDVVERGENSLLREIQIGEDVHREQITFYEPVQVHFERVGESGFIENTISDSDQGLILTFTFAIQFPGIEAGSAEERERGQGMKGQYVHAVQSTLARVRELVGEGKL